MLKRINQCYIYADCNEEISTPGTELTSPGYPNEYPNNINCTYLIRFNQDQRIVLKFLDFGLFRPRWGPPRLVLTT